MNKVLLVTGGSRGIGAATALLGRGIDCLSFLRSGYAPAGSSSAEGSGAGTPHLGQNFASRIMLAPHSLHFAAVIFLLSFFTLI